jgi:hypothetical protein
MSYQYELDWELEDQDGNQVQCTIGIKHFVHVQGSGDFHESNSDDYYGYTELEFDVLNIYDEPSAELMSLVTKDQRYKIEHKMIEIIKEQNERNELPVNTFTRPRGGFRSI